MKTSRQRVIEYIESKEPATANEVSRALHMTQANARHHLAALVNEGVIQMVGQRPVAGRGRPRQIYRLTKHISENNLPALASVLLGELFEHCPPAQVEQLLNRLAARLAAPPLMATTLQQRLQSAIQQLNCLHYQARWEAHAAGPHVIFAHCPYQAILEQHPVLCQMDKVLLQVALHAPANQIAKLEPNAQGLPQCVFKLDPPL